VKGPASRVVAAASLELIAFVASGINIESETQQNDDADPTANLGASLGWTRLVRVTCPRPWSSRTALRTSTSCSTRSRMRYSGAWCPPRCRRHGGCMLPCMILRAIVLGLLSGSTLVTACSDPSVVAQGASGAAGADGGTPDTRSFTPDHGRRSSSECGELTCLRFGDGPGVCRTPTEPATECSFGGSRNECCESSDCGEGQCFAVTTPALLCSATAGADTWNQCRVDECSLDDDCPDGLCTPLGFGSGRSCMPAACVRDEDCGAEPGGACALLALGCCRTQIGGAPHRETEIACVYPSDGCQRDEDCATGQYCVVLDGRAQCSASCP
jgi:hypothetical protein